MSWPRRRVDEWMDAPDADPITLEKSLRFIRQINRFLGYSRATVKALAGLIDPASTLPVRVLDVATGTADIPVAVLRQAQARRAVVSVVALDLHEATVRTARAWTAHPRLRFVRGDATALPFADGSFDVVMTGMFLHHLDDSAVVAVLREMNRVAARGVVIADLLRSRRAYAWVTLLTISANPMVRHDARASVAGAYTAQELTALARSAGLDYVKPRRAFGHRLILAGRKPAAG